MDRYNIALGKEAPLREESPLPEHLQLSNLIEGVNPEVSEAPSAPRILEGLVTITDSLGNRFEGFVQNFSMSTDRPVSTIRSMSGIQAFDPGSETTTIQMDLLVHRYIRASSRNLGDHLRIGTTPPAPRPTTPPVPRLFTPPAPTRQSSGGQSVYY
jgi:hypothetical protein